MIRKITSTAMFAAAIALVCAVVNAQEFPIMDKIANKVIQKYQTSTCEQLWRGGLALLGSLLSPLLAGGCLVLLDNLISNLVHDREFLSVYDCAHQSNRRCKHGRRCNFSNHD